MFLAIILAALVLVECTFFAFVWDLNYRLAVNRALRAEVETILCDYDRQLFNVYGIYAFSMENIDDEIFNKSLEANGYSAGEELTVYGTTAFSTEQLRCAVAQYYSYRSSGIVLNFMGDQFGEVIASLDEYGVLGKIQEFTSSEAAGYVGDILSGASTVSSLLSVVDETVDVSGYLEQSGALDSFVQDLQDTGNDLNSMGSTIDLNDFGFLTDSVETFISLNENMSDFSGAVGMQMYCAHYAAYNFDCEIPNKTDTTINGTSFSDLHDDNCYDAEYILTGFNGRAASTLVSAAIYGAMFGLDFLKLKQDKAFQAKVKAIATVVSAVLALITEGMVSIKPETLALIFTVIRAMYDGAVDLYNILKGETVSVFEADGVSVLNVGYRDFLFSFLLMVPWSFQMPRMLEILERDFGGLYTGVTAETQYRGYMYSAYKGYSMYGEEAQYA